MSDVDFILNNIPVPSTKGVNVTLLNKPHKQICTYELEDYTEEEYQLDKYYRTLERKKENLCNGYSYPLVKKSGRKDITYEILSFNITKVEGPLYVTVSTGLFVDKGHVFDVDDYHAEKSFSTSKFIPCNFQPNV